MNESTRWRIKGTDRWMTQDEMLGMNPNIMILPTETDPKYTGDVRKIKIDSTLCGCVTTSKRKQCSRRARYRYSNIYGTDVDMCPLHFRSWGIGVMADQWRFQVWYDEVGFERNDQAEVDDRMRTLTHAQRSFVLEADNA